MALIGTRIRYVVHHHGDHIKEDTQCDRNLKSGIHSNIKEEALYCVLKKATSK